MHMNCEFFSRVWQITIIKTQDKKLPSSNFIISAMVGVKMKARTKGIAWHDQNLQQVMKQAGLNQQSRSQEGSESKSNWCGKVIPSKRSCCWRHQGSWGRGGTTHDVLGRGTMRKLCLGVGGSRRQGWHVCRRESEVVRKKCHWWRPQKTIQHYNQLRRMAEWKALPDEHQKTHCEPGKWQVLKAENAWPTSKAKRPKRICANKYDERVMTSNNQP